MDNVETTYLFETLRERLRVGGGGGWQLVGKGKAV